MKLSLTVVLSILFFAVASLAQTPAQIDVTSITAIKSRNPEANISMTATGLPAPYQSPLSGLGSAGLLEVENTTAARIGSVFRTNITSGCCHNYLSVLYLGGGTQSDKYVKFTLTGDSPDLVLYPTILRKRQNLTVIIPATIKGKIEIFDRNTLIAVDDDVHLKGTIEVNYVQYLLNTTNGQRRAFDFLNLTFSYAQ